LRDLREIKCRIFRDKRSFFVVSSGLSSLVESKLEYYPEERFFHDKDVFQEFLGALHLKDFVMANLIRGWIRCMRSSV